MHLKKIIVSGFKSFADRVTLEIDQGITGIVGPNGSGKSNVIDAVRWVMGEQNAKNLRGEKATDIIFAGSQGRKALGMAEVTLQFDNTVPSHFCPPEYRHETEISLSRRLYVDGEREYLINKKACRLKDIVDFFATSGLGGRSYSMIQQGQVDRILNAKPEDVREILEEAAGTLLFKRRRADAEKKLEITRLNMARVDDILTEIDRQIASLSEQVTKAQKWQELTQELKNTELRLFAHNYHHFQARAEALSLQLDTQSSQEAENLGTLAHYEQKSHELQESLDTTDPDLRQIQEEIASAREQIARAESMLGHASTRIDAGNQRLKHMLVELDEDQATLIKVEAQLQERWQSLTEADAQKDSCQERLESFEHEAEFALESAQVLHGRLEEFQEEARNLDRLLDSNKVRAEAIARDLARAARERSAAQEHHDKLVENLVVTRRGLEEAESALAQCKAGLDGEIREKHDREGEIAARYGRIKVLGQERDQIKERYLEIRAHHTSLGELSTKGFDAGMNLSQIMALEPAASNLAIGLLAETLTFNDQGKHISTKASFAFEWWSERLVVKTLLDFHELASLTQRHDLGIIPVSIIELCRPVSEQAKKILGNYDAISFLSLTRISDSRIEPLLRSVFLLPGFGMEPALLGKIDPHIVIISAQGVVYHGGMECSLGRKDSGTLLSKKSERERLFGLLKEHENLLATAQSHLDELGALQNEDRLVIADIDERLRSQNHETLSHMSATNAKRQELDHKTQLIRDCDEKISKNQDAEHLLATELRQLNENFDALMAEREHLLQERESVKEQFSEVDDRKNEILRQQQSMRLDLAKAEERVKGLRDMHGHSRNQCESLQQKLNRRYAERANLENDIEKARKDQEAITGQLEELILSREQLEEQLNLRREANTVILEELKVVEQRLKECRDHQNHAQKMVSEQTLELERVKIAIQNIDAQSQEKYHIAIADFPYSETLELQSEDETKAIQRLRSRLEAMGPVNMMAIQEFEELSQRQGFVRSQREEIEASINLLESAILEIEETTVERFLQAFAAINKEFTEIFPVLFPTGEAQLVLSDANIPLNSGVEIMVRLPGKKPQNMNLFSGGEKALTAISLIFALLKTKPTPFCFLDEVDAPLDEANVGRFNHILEVLSDRFQFIIITHNRRTMEVLDTLYGVTMQEPGVSTVVGVDMRKDLPTHLAKAFKDTSPQRSGATTERPIQGASAYI